MQLIELFKHYLLSQKPEPSKLTIKNYLADLRKFISWYENTFFTSLQPQHISIQILDQFKQDLLTSLSASTMERHISTLRKFFHFLKIEGIISQDPFEAAEIAKNQDRAKSDPWHIKEFKNYLYIYNASHLTIKNYIIDVKQFLLWVKGKLILADESILATVTNDLVEEYKTTLFKEKTFSATSINRKLSSLRKYLSWATEQGYTSFVPKPVHNTKPITASIPVEELLAHSTPPVAIKQPVLQSTREKRAYSPFPPIRLLQKSILALDFFFEKILITPILVLLTTASYQLWKAQGKKIFTKESRETSENLLAKVHNIGKHLYAPEKISLGQYNFLQKTIFHLRFTRPKWYKRYQSYAVAHYFNLAVLIIFSTAIGFGFYTAFLGSKAKTPTFAAAASPLRILSFQGRLTDSNDNPISTFKNLRFTIYDDPTASDSGGHRLWEEVRGVTPDQDGIFSTLMGTNGSGGNAPLCNGGNPPSSPATGPCGIPQSLFTQHATLYLGVTVENTSELIPRQQIATVPYASNAESLQGMLPTTDANQTTNTNTVLALNSSGTLAISGTATTTFQSTGGALVIQGNTLVLNTPAGTNTNIQLAPDGSGFIDAQKPLQNSTQNNNIKSANGSYTAAGAVEVDDLFGVLATSSGQSAFTVDQDGIGPIISASHSGVAEFTVDSSGNGTFAGNVNATTFNGTNLSLSGNVLSNLTPSAADTYSLGTSPSNEWLNLYVKNLYTSGGQQITQLWQENGAALSPLHITDDLLLGSTATNSAVFGFINVQSGIPTATISAGVNGGIYITAQGKIATTAKQNITIGDSNSANVVIPSASVGIGTTSPIANLQVNANGGSVFIGDNTNTSAYLNVNNQGFLGYDGNFATVQAGSGHGIKFNVNNGTFGSGTVATITSGGTFGIGTTAPLATFDVRGNSYTTPVASISGANGIATLSLDQSGVGDLLTASNDGAMKLRVTNQGVIYASKFVDTDNTLGQYFLDPAATGTSLTLAGDAGFGGQLAPRAEVDVNGSASISANLSFYGSATAHKVTLDDGGNLGIFTSVGGTPVSNPSLYIASGTSSNAGNVGIGNSNPGANLDITGTLRVSSTVTFTSLSTAYGLLYANSGVLGQTTSGAANQCLTSNGGTSAPSWTACSAGGSIGGYWTLDSTNGVLYPINSTVDLLVGGTATTSSIFAVTGANLGSAPAASVSATAGGNKGQGIVLGGDGSIQSLLNRQITIGGSTTGNILLKPLNGTGTVSIQGTDLLATNASFNLLNSTTTSINFGGGATGTILIGNTSGQTTVNSALTVANGNSLTVGGNIADNGTALTTAQTSTPFNLLNTNVQTINFGGAATTALNIGSSSNTIPINLEGNVTLGNSPLGTNTITSNGLYNSDLVPSGNGLINLGSSSHYYQTLYVNNITVPVGNGTNGYWTLNSYLLSPSTAAFDLAVGGSATSSAAWQVFGQTIAAQSAVAGTATTSGNLSFRGGTRTINGLNGASLNFQTSVGGDSGLSSRLYITNNGNIGINTTTPGALFDINGNATSSGNLAFRGSATAHTVTINDGGTLGFYTSVGGSAVTNPSLFITSGTSGNFGNVGIGTATIKNALDVNGAATVGYGGAQTAPNNGLLVAGNVGINTTNPLATLQIGGSASLSANLSYYTAAAHTVTINDGGTLGFYTSVGGSAVTNPSLFIASGTSATAGNIGIGTTSPSYELTIAASDTSANNTTAAIALKNTAAGGGNWYMRAGATGTNTIPGGFSIANDQNYWFNVGLYGNVGIGANTNSATNLGNAALVINQINNQGTGDILSASTSGVTEFTIANNGTIKNSLIPNADLTYNLGSNTLRWNNVYANNLFISNANGGTAGFWTLQSNVLYPSQTWNDLAVGGTGTSSAVWQVFASNDPTQSAVAGTATTSGNLAFRGSNTRVDLLNNANLGFYNSVGGNTGLGANPALYIGNNGYIGIQTNNPLTGLHLSGSDQSAAVDAYYYIGRRSNGVLNFPDLYGNSGGLVLASTANHETQIALTTTYIDLTGGNVGIGTTNPLAALQVVGSASESGNLTFYGQGTNHTIPILNNGTLGFYNSVGGDTGVNSSTPALYIANSANVGIGTNNPGENLDILGSDAAITVRNSKSSSMNTTIQNVTDANTGFMRSVFGSNIVFNNITNTWNVANIGNNDFAALTHENNNGFAFYTALSTASAAFTMSTAELHNYERMFITARGFVGIGNNNDSGTIGNAQLLVDQRGLYGPGDLFTASSSGTPEFTIKNNGYVGIGQTAAVNPQGILHIASTSTTDDLIVNQAAGANLVTMPSFETNTLSGWALATGSEYSTSQDRAMFGSYSLKFTKASGGVNDYAASPCISNIGPATTYTLSAYVYRLSGYAGNTRIDMEEYDTSAHCRDQAPPVATDSIASTTSTNQWVRLFGTVTTQNTTAFVRVRFVNDGSSTGTAYLDGFQLEQTSSPTPYMDGSFGPGYFWTGTPASSSSQRNFGAIFAKQTINSASGIGAASYQQFPTLQLEQDGTGDIIAASAAGVTKFKVTQGIGGGAYVYGGRFIDIDNPAGTYYLDPAQSSGVGLQLDAIASLSGQITFDGNNYTPAINLVNGQALQINATTSGQGDNGLVTNDAIWNDGSVTIGRDASGGDPSMLLKVATTSAQTTGNFVLANFAGIQGVGGSTSYFGINSNPTYNASAGTLNALIAYQGNPVNASWGTITSQLGFLGNPQINNQGITTNLEGVRGSPQITSATGIAANMWGIFGDPIINNTGVATNAASVRGLFNLTGNGNVTNAYGALLELNNTTGTIQNYYGEYIAAGATTNNTAGAGTVNNRYALVTEANAGNVGIGTTAPVNKLDVNGAVAIGTYAGTNTAPSNGLIVSGSVGIGTTSPTNTLDVVGDVQAGKDTTAWGENGWSYRRQITINNSSGQALINYQVKLTVDTASLISAGKMQSNCGDLRITDTDAATELSYWVESGCNTNATTIWVKIPSIPGPTKMIYLYYGSSGKTTQSLASNVFIDTISNVQAAYRLDEPSYNVLNDFSGNNYTASASGTTSTTGEFNNARSFNGSSDFVTLPSASNLNTSTFTYIAWVNPNSVASNETIIGHSAANGPQFRLNTSGQLQLLKENTANIGNSAGSLTAGQWSQVAVTYDGTTLKFYINGVQSTTQNQSNQTFTFSQFLLGKNGANGSEFFNGTIDEVRMYNTILSAGQISELYNNYGYVTTASVNTEYVRKFVAPEPTINSYGQEQNSLQNLPTFYVQNTTGDVALGTTSVSSTSALLTVAGDIKSGLYDPTSWGSTFAGDSYRERITIDNTNSASTSANANYQVKVTANTAAPIALGKMRSDCNDVRFTDADGSTNLNYWMESGCNTTSTIFWVKVPILPPAQKKNIYMYYGNSSASTSVSSTANTFVRTNTNVVGAWRFDETSGTNATDYSGNGLTGAESNTTIVGGIFNNALSFNGSSSKVTVTVNNVLKITGNWTLSAWIYTNNAATSQSIIEKFDGTGTNGYILRLVGSKVTCISLNGTGGATISGLTNVTSGRWHHVACVYNGSTLTPYLDGAADNVPPATNDTTTPTAGTSNLYIGQRGDNTNAFVFNGQIDEPRVYSTALSAAAIYDMANAANPGGYYGYVTTNSAGNEYIRAFENPEPVTTVDTEQDSSQVDPTLYVNNTFNRVGVGTANPNSTLDVEGNSSTLATVINQSGSGDLLNIESSGISKLYISNAGNVGIANSNPTAASLDFGGGGNFIHFGGGNTASDFTLGDYSESGVHYLGLKPAGTAQSFVIDNDTNSNGHPLWVNTSGAGWVVVGGNFGTHGTKTFTVAGCSNSFTVSCVDYAEYYNSSELAGPADVMTLDSASTSGKLIKHATQPYDSHAIGVVSTNPAIAIEEGSISIGRNDNNNPVYQGPSYKPAIALAGRVPVKISTINGPVHVGDAVTTSSISGYAMKATKAGPIIGKVMQDFDPANNDVGGEVTPCPVDAPSNVTCGQTFIFVNTSWYDPDVYLTSTGNFNITPDSNGEYQLLDQNSNPITRMGAFLELAIANLRVGSINAQQTITNTLAVATDNVSIAGKSLQQYILDVVNGAGIVANGGHIISPLADIDTLHTNVISPLSQTGSIGLSFDDTSINVHAGTTSASPIIATIDNSGNASFSGSLNSQNLAVNQDATISGTLYAHKIIADDIEGLAAKVSTLAAQNITNVTNIYFATPSATGQDAYNPNSGSNVSNNNNGLTASDSGSLATNYQLPTTNNGFVNVASYSALLAYTPNLQAETGVFTNGLISNGQTTLTDTTIAGQLAIGAQFILSGTSINVLGGDLQLQPLRQGGIDIAQGAVRFDENGNVTFNGTAVFNGTLAAKVISPLAGNDLTIQLPADPSLIHNSEFIIQNSTGSAIFKVTQLGDIIASGAASFAKLNLPFIQQAQALSSTEIVATGSAGTATINAYQHEITIDNPAVTNNSLIYITPVGQTYGETPALTRQVPATSFTVGIEQPITEDIKFNWLIIN